jgi:hypothetical protein
MNAAEQRVLVDGIGEGAAQAPDAHVVLAEVQARIVRGRRRRRIGGAVTAVVAALAVAGLLVGGVGGLAGRSHRGTGQWAGVRVEPVPPQRCTVRLGWVPAGLRPPLRGCGPLGESLLYPMAGGAYLRMDVSNLPWQHRTDLAGWERVDIGGRTGLVASRATRTILWFALPSGRWANLEYGKGYPSAQGGPQAGLRADALTIARAVSEDGTDTVRVGFVPAYLPPGMRLAEVATLGPPPGFGELSYGDGSLALRTVGTSGTEDGIEDEDPVFDRGHTVSIRLSAPDPELDKVAAGTPVATVAGRPAYLINQGTELVVPGFHGGDLTVSTTSPGAPGYESLPREELIRIAQGVRWLG